MSLIENLFQCAQKTAQIENIKRENIQPTLLRSAESMPWYTNRSVLFGVITSIGVGMILLGVFLSQQKPIDAPHPLKTSPIKKILIPQSKPGLVQNTPIASAPASTQSIKMTYTNDDANHLYDVAISLMKQGHGRQAISNLQKAIQINPQFQQAREALAALYIQNDNISAAMSTLNSGLALSPGYTQFIKLKAQIFVNEGLYDDAINLLTKNMPSIESNTGYYELLAAVYDKQRKYLVAADIYHQLTQVNPDNGQWWFGMGASLNLAGKSNESKLAYEKALEVGGLKPDVQAYLETQLTA